MKIIYFIETLCERIANLFNDWRVLTETGHLTRWNSYDQAHRFACQYAIHSPAKLHVGINKNSKVITIVKVAV